jgi:aminopeptidase N
MKKAFFILSLAVFGCNLEKPVTTEKEMNRNERDPHSYARPEEARVVHLNWLADVNFERKVIAATAELTIEKTKEAREVILDTKGLNILTVSVDGAAAEYNLGAPRKHLGQPLTVSISEAAEKVSITYETTDEAEALQWLEPVQTAGKTHPFLFTQSQAILARTWVPIQDSPGIRFTYEAQVTVPSSLMAVMSAENPQEKNESGVYRFKMAQPIPAYLLALAVGDLEFESVSRQTGVYAEPEMIEKAVYEFADMQTMVDAAEGLYGPYRWERYDVIVLPPSFPFGGMENPRLTFATPTILAGDRSLVSLIAHELAHSWSGNLVTNATWNDFWLNEGFTVYFEQRIMEEVYGRDYSEMLAALSLQGLKEEIDDKMAAGEADDTHLKLQLKDRNPDDGVSSIAYDKGYFFLRLMEEQVRREEWDAFLRQYFEENAFTSMTTESFLDYLNTNLFEKKGLERPENIYASWIYGPGLPESHPKPVSDRFDMVDEALNQWQDGIAAELLHTKHWSTHEWLHFLNNLPDTLPVEKMQELDEAFGFTTSGNSEIQGAWFIHVIANDYEAAYPALDKFLVETGRRKFLTPLYKEMVKTEEGKIMARDIYERARPNYHFVSTNTLDAVVN